MNTYTCPNCGKAAQRKLKDTALLLCPNCSGKAYGTIDIPEGSNGVPDDLSLIQIGSTGKYQNKKFEIVGRVRIETKDDFRSLWCATYDDEQNPTLWICQCLDSISFAAGSFNSFPPKSDLELKAGGKIVFGDRLKLFVTFVSKCESIHYEGEIAKFPKPDGNFLFIQGSNNSNTVLVVCIDESLRDTEMLWAETKQLGEVHFENTRKFDDWAK